MDGLVDRGNDSPDGVRARSLRVQLEPRHVRLVHGIRERDKTEEGVMRQSLSERERMEEWFLVTVAKRMRTGGPFLSRSPLFPAKEKTNNQPLLASFLSHGGKESNVNEDANRQTRLCCGLYS